MILPAFPVLNTLMYLSLILISGLLFGRLAKLVKLPNVTGYLIAGLVFGPFVLKVIPQDVVDSFSVISEIALAFIAFTIGLTFKKSYFRRVGLMPVVIALFESLVAVFLVQGVLIATGHDPAFSIVLGAIAAATAPAATIMVIRQYNARGPVTETLMSVVAIDDAVALMAFGFAVTIAKVMTGASGDGSLVLSILKPFGEILLALAIGVLLGLLMKLPLPFFKKPGNRLIIIVAFVFMASGLASFFGVSALLSCMMLGATLCNISSESDSIANLADGVTSPIFLMFFVVSGAQLDLGILPSIGIIGLIYVIVRVIGKWLGAYLGALIMKAPSDVKKWIGPTLIPQAGVAIGLTLVAASVVPEYAPQIRAVILCGTVIYEMIGPAVTKFSLTKAGEIRQEKKPVSAGKEKEKETIR